MTIESIFRFPRWLVRRPNAWFLFWAVVIPSVFLVDQWLSPDMQLVPAFIMFWLLAGALTARPRHDQLLLAVLVGVATVFEIIGSLVLHWYTYRLHNIPPWVPPGHGIIFLTAILALEQTWAVRHELLLRNLATVGALAYASFGLARYHDVAGALFTGLFLVWLWVTGSRKARFYTYLWLLVCAMELSGVWLGAWHWSATMPITGLLENNPPSGIVGAYGFFDLVAFAIAAAIASRFAVRPLAVLGEHHE